MILNRFRNNDLTLVYFIQLYVSGMEGFLFENFMLRDTSLSQLKNLLRKLITRHEIVISIVWNRSRSFPSFLKNAHRCRRIIRRAFRVRMYSSLFVLQSSRARCLACISSRNYIPRLSRVYVSATQHLREYTQQVRASTHTTSRHGTSNTTRFVFLALTAFSKGKQNN